MAGLADFATNANCTPVASMDLVVNHGNAIVTVDGEAYFANKIWTTAQTTNRAKIQQHAIILVKADTLVPANLVIKAKIAKFELPTNVQSTNPVLMVVLVR